MKDNENGIEESDKKSKRNNKLRDYIFVNCWHLSDFESDAMWKLYTKGNEGIAIQSNYSRLRYCLSNLDTDLQVYSGIVEYIDYKRDFTSGKDPVFCKRNSFQHEKEVRAVIDDSKLMFSDQQSRYNCGANMLVDLNDLIENIYIAPTSASWFHDLVKSVCNRYRIQKEIIQSSIIEKPLF